MVVLLPSKPHNSSPNIPYDKVCIHFTCLFNFKSVSFLLVITFCFPQLTVSVVFLIWIVSMTGIVFVRRFKNMDVAAMSLLHVLVFGVHSRRFIENMYS
jgi:hypothetical protein